jgi:hypothetical protein
VGGAAADILAVAPGGDVDPGLAEVLDDAPNGAQIYAQQAYKIFLRQTSALFYRFQGYTEQPHSSQLRHTTLTTPQSLQVCGIV